MADFGFQTSQASGTSGIGGSGTTNYVSKFTAASTIGDSQIFDNGTNVGIGTITPTAKLDVYINSTSQLKYDSELTLNGLNGGISGGSYLKFTAIPAQSYNLIRSSGDLGFTADGSSATMLLKNNGNVGVGTISPTAMVHSKGIDATSSNFALKVENSASANLLSVRNDGVVDIYGTITPRLQSIVSSATVTPTNLNDEVVITAQATGLTLVNPTGTAVQGQSMIIRIKDNGTARTIAYDTQYRAIGVTLPTTTVINKIVYLGLIYNSTDTKWDVIGVSQEA
jgi:hypothetical protein